MTVNVQDTQNTQNSEIETPKNDKEYNFAQIRNQLERERKEKQALADELEKTKRIAQQALASREDSDDDESEPYVDHRKLEKKLAKFGAKTQQETDERINTAVHRALSEERRTAWLKQNPDFDEVMKHAQTLADKDPEWAETILSMPDTFDRHKLVYKNIKALGIHKPPETKPSIQETVDKNRRSPFYQPTGVGSAPYAAAGDFSPTGQKSAYDKMKELQNRLTAR